jgi:hypothetical protein
MHPHSARSSALKTRATGARKYRKTEVRKNEVRESEVRESEVAFNYFPALAVAGCFSGSWTLRCTTGAIWRTSAINSSNCPGKTD